MKKHIVSILALAGIAAGASIAYAGAGFGTGIVDSKHDMRKLTGVVESQQRVCAYCHTPHHKVESAALEYNPLWSHTVNESVFIAYDSITFDGLVTDPLAGPSRLCMSCHDGAIAVDQHYQFSGGTAAGVNTTHIRGDAWTEIAVGLGNNLAGDHPIGFDITNIVANDATLSGGMKIFGSAIKGTLAAPSNIKLNGKAFTSVGFDMGTGVKLFTCASCHEVHNKDNAENYFLYEKQAGSAICLMCHDK